MAHVGLHRANQDRAIAPWRLAVLRVDGVQLLAITCSSSNRA